MPSHSRRTLAASVALFMLALPVLAQSPAQKHGPPVPPAEAYRWVHLSGGVEYASRRGMTMNLWTATADKGESTDTFMARVGREALLVLGPSQAVICGQLVSTAGQDGIQLKTTNKPADCRAPGSTLPYMFVSRSETGAERLASFQSELPGARYTVEPAGIEFRNGTTTRLVASYLEE